MADKHLVDILNTEGLGRLVKVFADRKIDSIKFFDLPESLINFCFHNDAEAREKLNNLIRFKDFVKDFCSNIQPEQSQPGSSKAKQSPVNPRIAKIEVVTSAVSENAWSDPSYTEDRLVSDVSRQVFLEESSDQLIQVTASESDPIYPDQADLSNPAPDDSDVDLDQEEDEGQDKDSATIETKAEDLPEVTKRELETLRNFENFYTDKKKNNPYFKLLGSEYCFRGQLILSHYAAYQNIIHPDDLCKIVVFYEMGRTLRRKNQKVPFKLMRPDFERIIKLLLDLFPTEKFSNFYRPSIGKSRKMDQANKHPKRANAGGLLYNKYLKCRMEMMEKTNLIYDPIIVRRREKRMKRQNGEDQDSPVPKKKSKSPKKC